MIGGWVRDLLLHRPSTDIDIVVVKKVAPLLNSVPPTTPPTKGESIQLPSNLTPSLVGRDGVGLPSIGIELAQAVAKRLGKGAHLSVFRTYGTAQVKRGEMELEFVGARKESYRHDSRNPIVEDGTHEENQNRREFTNNTLTN